MPPVRMPLLSLTIAQLWLTNVEESTIEINAVFKCILYFKNNNTKCNNLSFTKSIAILDFFRCYTSVYIRLHISSKPCQSMQLAEFNTIFLIFGPCKHLENHVKDRKHFPSFAWC